MPGNVTINNLLKVYRDVFNVYDVRLVLHDLFEVIFSALFSLGDYKLDSTVLNFNQILNGASCTINCLF